MKKIFSIFTSCLAFMALISCGAQEIKPETTITGTVTGEETQVRLVNDGLDTLLNVTDGKFTATIPTTLCSQTYLVYGSDVIMFIADGTDLTATFAEEATITSATPKISATARMNAFEEESTRQMEEFEEKKASIENNMELDQEQRKQQWKEFYEAGVENFYNYNIEIFNANKDNFLGLIALLNIADSLTDEEITAKLAEMSKEAQGSPYAEYVAPETEADPAPVGSQYIDFTIPQGGPDKKAISLSDFVGKGKYLMVDFWASWCGPCVGEIPNIQALYEKYSDKLEIVSVAVWDKSYEVSEEAARQHGVTWPQIFDAQRIPSELYGFNSIPHIILISPEGVIIEKGLRGNVNPFQKNSFEYIAFKYFN